MSLSIYTLISWLTQPSTQQEICWRKLSRCYKLISLRSTSYHDPALLKCLPKYEFKQKNIPLEASILIYNITKYSQLCFL